MPSASILALFAATRLSRASSYGDSGPGDAGARADGFFGFGVGVGLAAAAASSPPTPPPAPRARRHRPRGDLRADPGRLLVLLPERVAGRVSPHSRHGRGDDAELGGVARHALRGSARGGEGDVVEPVPPPRARRRRGGVARDEHGRVHVSLVHLPHDERDHLGLARVLVPLGGEEALAPAARLEAAPNLPPHAPVVREPDPRLVQNLLRQVDARVLQHLVVVQRVRLGSNRDRGIRLEDDRRPGGTPRVEIFLLPKLLPNSNLLRRRRRGRRVPAFVRTPAEDVHDRVREAAREAAEADAARRGGDITGGGLRGQDRLLLFLLLLPLRVAPVEHSDPARRRSVAVPDEASAPTVRCAR